jgi:hypothetical protein
VVKPRSISPFRTVADSEFEVPTKSATNPVSGRS